MAADSAYLTMHRTPERLELQISYNTPFIAQNTSRVAWTTFVQNNNITRAGNPL